MAAPEDKQLVVSQAPAGGLRLVSGDKAAPVTTQTAAIGVITPPPDIRSIVVRTRRTQRRCRPRPKLRPRKCGSCDATADVFRACH